MMGKYATSKPYDLRANFEQKKITNALCSLDIFRESV